MTEPQSWSTNFNVIFLEMDDANFWLTQNLRTCPVSTELWNRQKWSVHQSFSHPHKAVQYSGRLECW